MGGLIAASASMFIAVYAMPCYGHRIMSFNRIGLASAIDVDHIPSLSSGSPRLDIGLLYSLAWLMQSEATCAPASLEC